MPVFEYLPEFRTERKTSRLRRNPAHVIVLEHISAACRLRRSVDVWSKRQKGVSFFVNIRWYSETVASSF